MCDGEIVYLLNKLKKRIYVKYWTCNICGWAPTVPKRTKILLHSITNCSYKTVGHHGCLTPYIKHVQKIKKKLNQKDVFTFDHEF